MVCFVGTRVVLGANMHKFDRWCWKLKHFSLHRWFNGTAASGVGGPHVGANSIWPMAITMQALTSNDDKEIAGCLEILKQSTAGTGAPLSRVLSWLSRSTRPASCLSNSLCSKCSPPLGFMHESFNKDNFGSYTRPWFAWANSLFGELILKTASERPHLIF